MKQNHRTCECNPKNEKGIISCCDNTGLWIQPRHPPKLNCPTVDSFVKEKNNSKDQCAGDMLELHLRVNK